MNKIEKIRMKKQIVKGVIYARFSTEMQRDESIDAQIRAIREYADKNDVVVVGEYIDKAKSATSDKRPQFQQMIADAKQKKFDIVFVHKLDRFARNRNDSICYRMDLKKNGVELISVLEYLDDSPESIILESVIEAMNEYYSKNLAREVEKGKRENALQGKHVGGIPPLGYDVDRSTMTLVINEREAEAVRLIFQWYLEGNGYTKIIDGLNEKGYKTKRGVSFGGNSIHEIVRNPKYCGLFVYNRSAPKSFDGTHNRHSYKHESEIITIDGGVPAIVSKEDFELVQKIMQTRRKQAAKYKAKETYLLSGKIVCGECGSTYGGNSRKSSPDHPMYVSYRCVKKNKKVKCNNSEIRRERLEAHVLDKLAEFVFDDKMLPDVIEGYKSYLMSVDRETFEHRQRLQNEIKTLDLEITNIVTVMAQTASTALVSKLNEMEKKKAGLEYSLDKIANDTNSTFMNKEDLKEVFGVVRKLFKSGQLAGIRQIIERFLDKVVIYQDHIEILLNFDFNLKQPNRAALGIKKEIPLNDAHKSNSMVFPNYSAQNYCAYYGGEGALPSITSRGRITLVK